MTRALTAAFLAVALLAGCTKAPTAGAGKDKEKGKKGGGPPVVGVARPRIETVGLTRKLEGNVESTNQVAIVPQLAGQLESVLVSVGDQVRVGQLLATVDDSQLEAQVSQARSDAAAAQFAVQTALANSAAARDQVLVAEQAVFQAEAQVIASQAALSKAETQLKLARKDLGRIREVYAKDLISAQVVDQTAAVAESAAADVRSAEAQLRATRGLLEQNKLRAGTAAAQQKAAQSQVASARAQASSQQSALAATEVRLGYTRLTSPLNGVVIAKPLDPGAYVAPSSTTPVLVVASLDQLRVAFPLTESDLPMVHVGQKLAIRFDAFPTKVAVGRVARLAGGLDPSTRSMRVEVHLDDPPKGLRPGMLARLQLEEKARKIMVIPIEGVVPQGKDQYVWVVGAGNVVTRKKIEVGELQGDVAQVHAGLTEDDTIVVQGVDQVQDGKPVKPESVE